MQLVDRMMKKQGSKTQMAENGNQLVNDVEDETGNITS